METILFFHFLLFIHRTKRNIRMRNILVIAIQNRKNTDNSTDGHCVAESEGLRNSAKMS